MTDSPYVDLDFAFSNYAPGGEGGAIYQLPVGELSGEKSLVISMHNHPDEDRIHGTIVMSNVAEHDEISEGLRQIAKFLTDFADTIQSQASLIVETASIIDNAPTTDKE